MYLRLFGRLYVPFEFLDGMLLSLLATLPSLTGLTQEQSNFGRNAGRDSDRGRYVSHG